MIRIVILLQFWLFATPAFSDDIFRIEVGPVGGAVDQENLRLRVRQLEEAVRQLQYKVFEIKTTNVRVRESASATWLCKVEAMGNVYSATGGSRAVAEHKALKKCAKARDGDSFFCKDAKCEQ